ncbi:tryptophan synthase subunit alpha [Nonomuraea jiangxiensis]|uniref:Tryptophan synthase alpha chain n=1 Tax=Nonomuraea jiangxiensis TaxID=633440 RepID=A0A1G7Z203_9ACTN|nr:tryptophan synthase subunit alpha [Nonomuraea jiangxiensis]SDH02595.1 tryptophan synthase, alpha chain [Nonomuraea jiangxiensis]
MTNSLSNAALDQGSVERQLRARRDGGRRLLMPYVTGGITPDWTAYLRAFAAAGADAIEVGLPFSDPTLDGATIQEATDAALARGATTRQILADLAELPDLGIPLVASTYYNLVLHDGPEAFCAALRRAGVAGLIVPDLPLHEADELTGVAAAAGIELALLASPTTPEPRLAEIGRRSRGFVYAVSIMGTTGERADLAASATELTRRIKLGTDRPVLLGFGISTPEQAREAGRHADGVVVGAAVMRRVLDGAGPDDLRAFLATLRRALDQE